MSTSTSMASRSSKQAGTQDAGMVVVGGGECGARAAFALRANGWTGPVTVIGREPLHAYERPPLSKAALTEDDWETAHPYRPDEFARAGIEFRVGSEASTIEPDHRALVLENGEELRYAKLLLAVGAQPRRLPFPADAGLLYLRTRADALRIKTQLQPGRTIGIIGAGFIGLELAASARARGCQVVVIEAGDRALARAVPAGVAARVVALHADRGVEFRWETTLTAVAKTGTGLLSVLSTGEELHLDAVIVGIGAGPDTGLAQASGLAVADGIEVDEHLRTSVEGIFAAGDCASVRHPLFGGARVRLEAWRNAIDQADTAAANMLGEARPHLAVPWFWSDQYGQTLQVAGLTSLATQSVTRLRDDGLAVHFGIDAGGRLVYASAIGPGNAVARDIRLAEKMIERQVHPPLDHLADPTLPLKSLLTASLSAA